MLRQVNSSIWGGYYGHQATLSESPQPYWLQSSSENGVSPSSDESENVTTFISQDQLGATNKFLGFTGKPSIEDVNDATLENMIGIYNDKAISSDDVQNCQWTLESVGDGVYYLAILLPENQVKTRSADNSSKKYYLTISKNVVLGSSSEDQHHSCHFYDLILKAAGEVTDVTAVTEASDYVSTMLSETADNNAQWKFVSVYDYENNLVNEHNINNQAIDVTYLIKDPNFSNGNAHLSSWKTDETLTNSTSDKYSETKLAIGYDGYYKTSTADQDYLSGADYNLTGDTRDNGSESVKATHSQYMAVCVKNGGYGKMYQTVEVTKPGTYTIQCLGTSDIDEPKLFIAKNGYVSVHTLNSYNQEYHSIDQAYTVAKNALQATSGLYWPYDTYMPAYNATVLAHNNIDFERDESINITEDDLKTGGVTLTFGINVSKKSTGEQSLRNPGNPIATYDADEDTGEDTEEYWKDKVTTFGNFRLFYQAEKTEGYDLVLDEDFPPEPYERQGNNSLTFNDKTLHFYRTLHKDKWNSIILPVGLTKKQITDVFGEGTRLAKLDELTTSKIIFKEITTEEAYGDGSLDATPYLLKPMTPYIIKPEKVDYNCNDIPQYVLYDNNKEIYQFQNAKNEETAHYKFKHVSMIPGIAPFNSIIGWYFLSGMGEDEDDADAMYVVKCTPVEGNGTLTPYGTFCPTYIGEDLYGPAMKRAYVWSNDKFVYLTNGGKTKGYRCYYRYTSADGQTNAKMHFEIAGIDDSTTSIEGLTTETGVSQYGEGVYNLNGQCLRTDSSLEGMPKGVYIVNGKKIIKE